MNQLSKCQKIAPIRYTNIFRPISQAKSIGMSLSKKPTNEQKGTEGLKNEQLVQLYKN